MNQLSDGEGPFLACVYTHNGEMVRHFDRLKYTAWTVYTVIIAGLWVAKSGGEINREEMLGIVTVASIYFVFLVSRIQRNYKVFYASSHSIERHIAPSLPLELKGPALPFIEAGKQVGYPFWEMDRWDRIFGRFSYFYLKMAFFLLIPLAMWIVYYLKGDSELVA
jgi:hypothetical protein